MSQNQKVVDLRTATRVPAATKPEPAFETTLAETLAVRKFIELGISDLRQQLEQAARDTDLGRHGTSKKLFNAQKANAVVITAWLTSALMMVDGMLAEAAARTNSTLAQEIKNEAPAA